jgi:dTDP-4-amino-4,6-dideoxygalactose transaminase
MPELAIQGGPAVIPRTEGQVAWPVVTAEDKEAVMRVMESGKFTYLAQGEEEVQGLEEEWARFVQTRYCVAVSNGTVALALALTALGVCPGDEVLVPALSFIASAIAPLHQCAIPVFVDIDPRTFNIDPQRMREKITPRTRAVVVVHLHGLPADMDEIRALAREHGLFVIEDAAQSHGATYKGQQTGALGEIATFSLNVSKNLPTCGEGALVTMQSPQLAEKMRMLRQYGEVITPGQERSYTSHFLGWNQKPNCIQAAFARSQLRRFPAYQARRQENVARFLAALADLPGVSCPQCPADRTHAWHILRLRFDPRAAGLADLPADLFREALQRVLRSEGVPLARYQRVPLPAQQVFQAREGFGHGHPWTLPGVPPQRYCAEDYPQTLAVLADSLTVQRVHLNPASGPLLERYAQAFHKVFAHLDVVARLARAIGRRRDER